MALDMVVDSSELNRGLVQIANAIREKGGTSTELVFPSDFERAVQALPDIKITQENNALYIR